MKNILTITLLFFIQSAISQTLEQNIQEIRTQFKWINSQKDFTKIVLENEEFEDQIPSEGCGLEGYYKNETLYKIVESDIVSMGAYTNEYYLKNNKLIFVFRKEVSFDPNKNYKETTTYEERVYYKNDKVIRHLEKMTSVLSENLDYKKLFKKYKLLLDSKVKHKKEYNLLQGTWIKTDDIDDWFIISGLKREQYFMADFKETFRFWSDGQYIYFHSVARRDDVRYEILKLTETQLEMQNRLTGDVEIYKKKKD